MVNKRVISVMLIIIIITALGCQILPKRKDKKIPPPQEKSISLKQEQVPSKIMAQSYFEEGMSYYLKGDLDKAITSFAEALKLDPEHPKARKMFEESLKKRTEIKPEIKEVKQRKKPESKEVSQAEVKRDKEPQLKDLQAKVAERPIEEKVTSVSKEKEIPKEKLPLIEVAGEEKKEEKKERIRVEKIPQEELRWFEFAKDLRKRGMYDDAIKELTRLLDEYPKSILADKIIYLRAEIYSIKGDYREAEKDYQTLIDNYPQSQLLDDARLRLADSYLLRGEYDQALLRYLRLVRDLKDKSKEIAQKEEKEEAITPLPQPKAVIAAKAQLGIAESYRLKKNYPNALIEYYEVIKSYTDRKSVAQALYYIGYIYDFIIEVRDFKRAVTAYERLVEDYPESIWASHARERKEYIEKNYL